MHKYKQLFYVIFLSPLLNLFFGALQTFLRTLHFAQFLLESSSVLFLYILISNAWWDYHAAIGANIVIKRTAKNMTKHKFFRYSLRGAIMWITVPIWIGGILWKNGGKTLCYGVLSTLRCCFMLLFGTIISPFVYQIAYASTMVIYLSVTALETLHKMKFNKLNTTTSL